MITKILTATNIGLQSQLIECEIDLSPSLPMVVIVGLPDKAVQESRERVKAAIKQSGYEFPLGKITINLAPADVTKSGSSLDLPMAVGILCLTGFIKKQPGDKSLFVGELSLDGKLRGVAGVLTICLWAKRNGYENIFIPKENESEAKLVKGVQVFAVGSLSDVEKHLNGSVLLKPVESMDLESLVGRSAGAARRRQTVGGGAEQICGNGRGRPAARARVRAVRYARSGQDVRAGGQEQTGDR